MERVGPTRFEFEWKLGQSVGGTLDLISIRARHLSFTLWNIHKRLIFKTRFGPNPHFRCPIVFPQKELDCEIAIIYTF